MKKFIVPTLVMLTTIIGSAQACPQNPRTGYMKSIATPVSIFEFSDVKKNKVNTSKIYDSVRYTNDDENLQLADIVQIRNPGNITQYCKYIVIPEGERLTSGVPRGGEVRFFKYNYAVF